MGEHLVRLVRHVRRELRRAVDGVSEADLERRVAGLNSVAWMVAHLAWQEQTYWLSLRGEDPVADLDAFRPPGPTPAPMPSFTEAWGAWERVTAASEEWLDSLDREALLERFEGRRENIGTLLTRVFGHYYVHIGQITAIRKLLGYDVPTFVGSLDGAYFE